MTIEQDPHRAMNASPSAAMRLLVLAPSDNVGMVLSDVAAGFVFDNGGVAVTARDRIPMGHKIALRPIRRGDKVVKFGAPIGSATRDIAPGEHVHTHNLASDYTPTHTLDGDGKLGVS